MMRSPLRVCALCMSFLFISMYASAGDQELQAEEARERALAMLLSADPEVEREEARAFAEIDALISKRLSENWLRPINAPNGMMAEIEVGFDSSGQVSSVRLSRSSGDAQFDTSALEALKKIGAISELASLAELNPGLFDRVYSARQLRFQPSDLDK